MRNEELTASGAWNKLISFAKRGVSRTKLKRILAPYPQLIDAMDAIDYERIQYLYCEEEKRNLKNQFIKVYEVATLWN